MSPVSPWQNPYVKSFNGRVRDELLTVEQFGTLIEAVVVVEAWLVECNTYRPLLANCNGIPGTATPVRVSVPSSGGI